LVGKDFNDEYSRQLKDKIMELNLEKNVFFYGSKQDVGAILEQSDIAILTSKSEGLPVSLLEYGWYKKPVVVTNVGEIPSVIRNGINGFIVPSNDDKSFYNALISLIESDSLQIEIGNKLHEEVYQNYSEGSILKKYLFWLQNK
jgi:glycosyltransferase involved in cell wall biosynthesis